MEVVIALAAALALGLLLLRRRPSPVDEAAGFAVRAMPLVLSFDEAEELEEGALDADEVDPAVEPWDERADDEL